jgi:hypothetical protein
MNNDPSSSTASAPANDEPDTNLVPDGSSRINVEPWETQQGRIASQNKKRESFVLDIMRKLDFLIYAELSALYYMESVPFLLLCMQRTY